jgi:signal transduction histidine kinase
LQPPSNTSARILIIDDEESSALALSKVIAQAGYTNCQWITDTAIAARRVLDFNPDLLLLDLHMEPVSGMEVLARITELMAPRSRPSVLVLTADTTPEAKHAALAAGATDFLAKPLDSVEVLLRIQNLLTARQLFHQCQVYSDGLERLVDKRTLQLQRHSTELEKTLTELRETQQQIIQQERMRALGTMACGIAHDLNNGLSVILGYGDMLLNNLNSMPPKSKVRTYLQLVVRAATDNASLVGRLREFYRPRTTQDRRQPVDLNEVIEQAISLTTPRWQSQADANGATIHIRKDLNEITPVSGAPEELREVLTNLIFNAVDAMPQGGELSFRTSVNRSRVRLEVADTGTGMNEETLRNCLEPFYTTKGAGGSGLGLAMSYGIIRRHGGTIELKSKLGKGTTFIIHLPVLKDAAPREEAELMRVVRPLNVLVVDDHPAICEIVSAYLAEDRHMVETAANASEAMEKFRAQNFDLVITDRAMPEISGDKLAASIKKLRPQEPIIMLTGFADLMDATGETSDNVDLVLSKPARLDDLRRAILEVIP